MAFQIIDDLLDVEGSLQKQEKTAAMISGTESNNAVYKSH